ncbi:DUF397 domain-containing protein [Streptomyces canus]|jgi:hypothetical protein|uniref:DUF397 domain-containing protein n=1 Tax=Streptomyces canus TaxID=58343 RepID=UPI0022599CE6|nr:DUF397 domain-containing protein [Streptomyces canus]
MSTPGNWRKSSYSGPGDGNSCVEIADDLIQVAIRDSKTPARTPLVFPAGAFVAFIDALKEAPRSAAFDPVRFRG